MSSTLTVVLTSPRIAAGQLTWPAWKSLRTSRTFASRSSRHVSVLRDAGVPVEAIDITEPTGALANLRLLANGATTVAWLSDPGDAHDASFVDALTRNWSGPVVEVVGAEELPGTSMVELVAVMDRLRSPGGCPWDAEQTHRSLVTYLIEETYEVIESIEAGDEADLLEELGDLLLQVVFHARIAAESEQVAWTIDDVAQGIVDKLVRRHPHVFGTASVSSADDVAANWEILKAAEKQRSSATEGVPMGQPALSLIAKLQHRVAKADIVVAESPQPQAAATFALQDTRNAEEFGDLLAALVSVGNARGWDAEQALRESARRFAEQVRQIEAERPL